MHLNPPTAAVTDQNFPPTLAGAVTAPELPTVAPPVNCHQVLESVARQLSKQLAAKRLELNMKLSARGYLIPGDPDRIRQVYMNLLSNAVTAAPKGSQILVKSTCPTPDALRVEVTHCGK